jgi:hypothetical protein
VERLLEKTEEAALDSELVEPPAVKTSLGEAPYG